MNIPLNEFLPLADIAKQLPNRPHLATIYRWTTRGIRGVKLRTYKVGRTRCTTHADLLQFMSAAADDVGELPRAEMGPTSPRLLEAQTRLARHGL
jgi:hypothetical protein